MKRALAILFIFMHSVSFACSSFLLSKNGQHVFGKNYDWVTGNGALMINARGLKKEVPSYDSGQKAVWISQYGSVTFNQFGKEFPNGGMNEKGLVIELMWLEGSSYPPPDGRSSVGVLQWIQYQLDCAATVADVLNSDSTLRVSGHEGVPLHYLVADASGAAATVEFIDGKRIVHANSSLPFPVLTNTTYRQSLQHLEAGTAPDNSLSRFNTACSLLQKFSTTRDTAAVPYAFDILNKVAQGDFTKWSIAYDLTAKKIFFSTSTNKNIREVDLSELDFTCSSPALAFPLSSPLTRAKFLPFTAAQNEELIRKSVQGSAGRLEVTEKSVREAVLYFNKPICK